MSITIYTYSNPYKLNKEPYWALVKNSFHLCVSQTLVNGLCDQYGELYKGKVTTITRFINQLFNDWESDVTAINQRSIVDNLIEYLDFQQIVNDVSPEDIIRSLKRNRGFVLDSIRIMFELGMNPQNIKKAELTYEQKCVVAIYEELVNTNNKHFVIKEDFTQDEIDKAITETMLNALRDKCKLSELDTINKNTVVVHGIHQFSPIMLKTIELLGKYKNVIILFNYLPDYKNVYQTWLNVYSWFESKISLPLQNFYNDSQEFKGGKIADNIAAMISGSTASIDFSQKIDVLEFDNPTEFAGYIAKKFEKAEVERAEDEFKHPALYYMEEQIYAANSKVNDVLKIFFPEQFGERNFLEYPIGHFFIAITNMWDADNEEMHINDLDDVYECLMSGIISEKKPGCIASVFNKTRLYFINETTIKGIIKRLKKLKTRIEDITSEEDNQKDELLRVDYYNVNVNDIDDLIEALKDLNAIADNFFKDFNEHRNDFKSFYKKVIDVLVSKVLEKEDLDDDFRDIVQRVLDRLNEVKDIDANASFDCLRETMQLYLQQNPKDGRGANWIVRNFEQIDGDVLRKNKLGHEKIYHFACLSDDEMSITHRDEFPWPLDINFFEVAQAPVDWKYQVYVTSRMEYKNFRRYALIYGLAFSKSKIMLSYIKHESEKENDLYYLLRILNATTKKYESEPVNDFKKNSSYIVIENKEGKQYSQYDLMKYRLCCYRFLLESAIEGNSIYKDEFTLKQYLMIILQHRARRHFSGKTYVKSIVYSFLVDQMDDLVSDFPFVNQLDIADIINVSLDYIEKRALINGTFTTIQDTHSDYMRKRELFLSVPAGKNSSDEEKEIFKNSTQQEVDRDLSSESLEKERFRKNINKLCDKCSEKEVCLEMYKARKKDSVK